MSQNQTVQAGSASEGEEPAELSVSTPRSFTHDLDPELFTPDRLDFLTREAEKRGRLKVQLADPGRERPGNEPIYTEPRYPTVEDARQRAIQYRIMGVAEWGGPEYRACRERIFELAGPPARYGRIATESVVRIFSPGAVVALHGDPDLKLVCGISGHTVWHVREPAEMNTYQHENLLRGEFFLRWWETPEQQLPIPPGAGAFVPSRWAHWLSHPCNEPIISFEMGFWTVDSVRERKVYDVNWGLRKLGLDPTGPGIDARSDHLKCQLFDLVCLARRRGLQYRGIG